MYNDYSLLKTTHIGEHNKNFAEHNAIRDFSQSKQFLDNTRTNCKLVLDFIVLGFILPEKGTFLHLLITIALIFSYKF